MTDESSGLEIPVSAEARQESVVIFQKQSPGFTVKAKQGFLVYEK